VKQKRGDAETRRYSELDPDRRVSLSGVITLTTDFGSADYFVGAMKGAILSTNPDARIVDLTHEVPAQDVAGGAFTLLAAYKSFPNRTVHVAVVDPGVGSTRRGIVVEAGRQFFVGPDNGIFSYIYEREPQYTVYELSNGKYFRTPVSATFHGRDIFAPVAAALAKGVQPATLGRKVTDPVKLASLTPEIQDNKLQARVIHIDRFGNCVTNITPQELTKGAIAAGAVLIVKGRKITSFRNFFAEKTNDRSKVFCVWGSAGFLEIAAQNSSAARILKVQTGTTLVLKVPKLR
jgi:S-adenosyl-L-methionine hydrolase (adenosine-forming)